MSTTGTDVPISYATLSPFYADYYLAYGASFWKPDDGEATTHTAAAAPPTHGSDTMSTGGRTRSTSVSSRKIAEQRLQDPRSFEDMFKERIMVRHRRTEYTVTMDLPSNVVPPIRYTAYDVYTAMGKLSNTIEVPTTSWGDMPSMYTPLVLPPSRYHNMFSKHFLSFGWHNLLRVWFNFTEVSEYALEDWTRYVLVLGELPGPGVATRALMTASLSDSFKDDYTLIVGNRALVERFIDSQAAENWHFDLDPISVEGSAYAKFLRNQALYFVKDFEEDRQRVLLWDSSNIVKRYPVINDITLPYAGEILSGGLQRAARRLLVLIVGKSPQTDNDIEIEFAKLEGTIHAGLLFFIGRALYVMAVRVVYSIGVKRIAVALARPNTAAIGQSARGEKMFPKFILPFAGSFLLMSLFKMAYSQEMHGRDVLEQRPSWTTSAEHLFKDCCDSYNTLFAIPQMRVQLEAVLVSLYKDFGHKFVLSDNEQQTAESVGRGYAYTYSVPVLSSRLAPPSAQSGPVFTLLAPTSTPTAPLPAAASSSSSAATPVATSHHHEYETDSDEDEEEEEEDDTGITAYPLAH